MTPQSRSDSDVDADSVPDDGSPPLGGTGGYPRRPRDVVARIDRRFADLRRDDTQRRGALGLALVAGLVLAWLHWLGLVVGGALVGITRTGLGRAVLAGIAFGALVLVVFLATTPAGVTGLAVLSPASYLTVTMAIGLPAVGALARGVV